jgi:hypothetical protein
LRNHKLKKNRSTSDNINCLQRKVIETSSSDFTYVWNKELKYKQKWY